MKQFLCLMVCVTFLCLSASVASASIIPPLEDDNSTATFDPYSEGGQFSWVVDGVEQLHKQWFWFRVGDDADRPINVLDIDVLGVTDTDFDGDPDNLFVRYIGSDVELELNVRLDGGAPGSHVSDLAEQITITNTTNEMLEFTFFQYVDLNLNGTAMNDMVQIINGRNAQQWDGGLFQGEEVIAPVPTHFEVDLIDGDNDILDRLNDGAPTDLNDLAGVVGPGDATWAFQWDFTIAPGDSVQISKDKQIVPEPASLLLISLGGLAMLKRRK